MADLFTDDDPYAGSTAEPEDIVEWTDPATGEIWGNLVVVKRMNRKRFLQARGWFGVTAMSHLAAPWEQFSVVERRE